MFNIYVYVQITTIHPLSIASVLMILRSRSSQPSLPHVCLTTLIPGRPRLYENELLVQSTVDGGLILRGVCLHVCGDEHTDRRQPEIGVIRRISGRED